MQSCIIIIYWFYNSISGFVMANQSGDGSSIKAINKTCVHKICSGQVVLTLATAVKELVENSLDAGATIIEVKLREYGKELLEVVDNGDGVKEEDFESLTLKHHTSKLENFSDLCSVETFGFRGEALSSLCALSDLTVVTCHKNASFGTKLEYDHNGVLIKASVSPRQVGTTVGLQNLFSTLPVRHKEFHRNLQKEFGKMVHLLTAYCLICTNKRITCVNQTVKGRKTIILSTQASSSVKENLAQVFGLKQVNNLLQISQLAPSESTLEEFNISGLESNASDTFRLEGYVSPCTHGEGRSSTDRQYFYINGRPCDLSKVSKIVNEVYHCYNRHQYPFVFLNVCLEKDAVDINVTPDKRQIFFSKEKLLLAIVKSSLLNIYEQKPSFVDCCPLGIVKGNKNLGLLSHLSHSTPSQGTKSPTSSNLKRTFPGESNINVHFSQDFKNPRLSCNPGTDYSMNETSIQATEVLERENIINVKAFSSDTLYTSNYQEAIADKDQCKKLVILPLNEFEDCEGASTQTESSLERHSLNLNVVSKWSSGKKLIDSSNNDICLAVTLPFHDDKVLNKVIKNDPSTLNANAIHNIFKFRRTSGSNSTSIMSPAQDNTAYGLKQFNKSLNHFQPKPVELYSADIIQKTAEVSSITKESILSMADSNQISNIAVTENYSEAESPSKIFPTTPETSTNDSKYKITTDEPALLNKKTKHINFSMDCIKEKLLKRGKYCSKNVLANRKFRSKITPSENQHAEGELKREISKNMFSEMEIIGQFNLGFIITKLKDDLFIIDQHATDEKYNFEILQRDTILETQKLLHPQSLEQTAIAESILLDNMHIFEKNGFKFNVIDNDKPGQRVRLVSVPVSHNWTFGKEDIDELIFMLTDNPGRMCRPSRISQMFASRSCRKSVMIGTPLQISDMKKLVCHMGEIEQPWNCPHGRPTIRHLFSMNILPTM